MKLNLESATVEQLVAEFVRIAVEHDQALLREEVSVVNALYDELKAVEDALKQRDGDQRRVLLPLYRHSNMQVRVKAAKATLAIATEAARGELEAIRAANWQPQSLEAGMSLRNLARGIYRPT